MAKQLNQVKVDLTFGADTSQVKKELQQLQKMLQDIAKMPGKPESLLDDKQIKEASKAAMELQKHLSAAMNVDTGKLDLSRFSASLKKSGQTLDNYYNKLSAIGPVGTKAFLTLSQSIANAEMPTARLNAKMTEFLTTLKNTARWQISSSILHGFMSTLQSAYGYAQDLNNSLNDIRIVTGQSVDQMAEFAVQANKSARALSATTTAYTDAALIFYQQGLDDDAVKERTDAVIKMSNVTGEAVKDVSSYMTAIWNNFDDGSQSLEHYADVITALGAATASSSEEIAGGLEKFASIGKTVGLSYDYATAALATVVSATRQSEDVVGNAFKTIFSRIQGLKLGETLEDDVDLNKYSSALRAVGVEVVTSTGELRDLDNILDDLAGKWDTLTSAQQTALAQTVAGTRQYAQFIALMGNWDSMTRNLEIAKGAEGSLQEQEDIYAQSWEAARKRVKASAEGLYQAILDDEFFIKITDNFSKLIDGVKGFTDAIGGLGGVLRSVGGIFLTIYAKQWPAAIDNLKNNFIVFTGQAAKLQSKVQDSFQEQLTKISESGNLSLSEKVELESTQQLFKMKQKLLTVQNQLTEEEKRDYQQKIDNVQLMYKETSAIAKQVEEIDEKIRKTKESVVADQQAYVSGVLSDYNKNKDEQIYLEGKIKNSKGEEKTRYEKVLDKTKEAAIELEAELYNIQETFNALETEGAQKINIDNFIQAPTKTNIQSIMQKYGLATKDSSNTIDKLITKYKELNVQFVRLNNIADPIQEQIATWKKVSPNVQDATKAVQNYIKQYEEAGFKLSQNKNRDITALLQMGEDKNSVEEIIEALEELHKAMISKHSDFGKLYANVDKDLADTLNKLKALGVSQDTLAQMIQDMSDYSESLGKVEQSQENVRQEADANVESTEHLSTTLSNFAGTVMTVWSAVSTLNNAIDILSDENATAQEKIGAVVSALATMIPVIQSLIVSFKGATAASEGFKASLVSNPYGWVLLVISALVAALYAFSKIQKKVLENNEKILKEKREELKQDQEQIKANQQLLDSYKTLLKQKEEYLKLGEDISKINQDLRDTALNLSEAYNNVGISIAALAGDYSSLNALLKEQEGIELDKLISNDNENINNLIEQIQNDLKELVFNNFDNTYTLGNTYHEKAGQVLFTTRDYNRTTIPFLKSQKLKDNWEDIFNETLMKQKRNLHTFVVNDSEDPESPLAFANADFFGKDNFDTKLFTFSFDFENPQDVLNTYNTLKDARDIAQDTLGGWKIFSATYRDLNTLVNKFDEEKIKELEDAAKSFNEDKIKQFFYEAELGEETSALKLHELIEQVKQDSEEFIFEGNQTVDSIVDNYLKGIDEISDAYLKNKIAEIVADKTNETIENVINIIDNFNNSELSYLYIKVRTDGLEDGFQEFLNRNELGFKVSREKEFANQFRGILEAYNSEEGFSEAGFSFLEENGEEVGFNKEAFDLKDESQQIQEITDKWIEYTKKVVENREELIKTEDAYQGLVKGKMQDLAPKYQESLEFLAQAKDKYQYKVDKNDLDQIISYIQENGSTNGMSPELQLAFKKLDEEDQDNLIKSSQTITKYKEYQTELSLSEARVQDLLTTERDYNKELESRQIQLSTTISEMDEIKNSYQDLTSIIEDYNEAKNWSWENVKTLLDMEDEFVALLNIENGVLSLNEEGFKALAIAKATDAQVSVLQTLEDQLHNIIINKQTNDNYKLAESEYEHEKSVRAGIDAAKDGSEAWGRYATIKMAAIAAEHAVDPNDFSKAMKEATDAAYNRLQALQGYIDNINNNGLGNNKSEKTSSSKDKQKETKDLKKYLDEFDRFYPIKKAIEDVSDALSDLSKQQQHLAGKALANSLKEQNKLLQNQAELYKELLRQQEDYRNELAGTLGSFGMTFDAVTGNITNYAAATQSALERYNQAIIAYNASAQDEVAKATLKTAEEEYNAFKNTLSKYQSILKDIESTANNIDDIFYKQIENNLKAFEVEIKLDLDIEDAKRKVLDFIQEINTDFKKVYKTTEEWTKLFDVAASKARTFTEEEGTISTDLKALKEVSSILDNPDYNYGSEDSLFASKSDAINKYKELTETLMTDSKALYDLYQNSWQNYLSAVDQVENKWNDVIDDFDRVGKSLDHTTKITELLYGGSDTEAGRGYLDQIYGAKANNSLAKQTALKEEILALQKEYDEIIAAGASADEEDVKKIAKAIEDANDELDSEIESYLETIQNKLTNSIKIIMTQADKDMTGDYGVDKLIEEWNDAKAAEEGYYDDVQRTYQLQTAENKWKDLISSTSRIKDQQYLKKIMDSQLDNLKQKTKLSEYDVQLAEKELNIQKAYIALQNAQSNKNSMKLVRNQQGNWTYNYVADQDDIASKQQDFLDALNEKYEFTKTESDKAYEKVLNLYQTANEKLTALMNEYVNADETRRAEIEVEYNELYQKYYGEGGLIENAANEAAGKNEKYLETWGKATVGYYSNDAQSFKDMTDLQKGYLESLFGSDSEEGAAQKSISKTFGENGSGLETFGKFCEALTGEDKGIYKQILDGAANCVSEQDNKWTTLTKGIVDSWATGHTGKDGQESVQDVITGAYNAIKDKVGQYDQAIKDSENASGKNWLDVKKAVDDAAGATDTAKQKTEDLIKETDQLNTFRQAVDAIGVAWNGVKDSIEAAVSALDDYLKLLKEDTGKPQTPDYSTSTVGTGSGYTASDNSDNGNAGTTVDTNFKGNNDNTGWTTKVAGEDGTIVKSTTKEEALEEAKKTGPVAYVDNKNGTVYVAQDKTKAENNNSTGAKGADNKRSGYAQNYKLVYPSGGSQEGLTEYEAKELLSKSPPGTQILKMASGGYTGDWNSSEGRLAVLHEKELVLNKEDTSNILNAVNLVRGISNISDLVSNAISSNLAGMALSLTGLSSNAINRNISSNNSSNNTFNITAEFPNAGSVEEIREAILSLPNLAAQYLAQK